LRAVATPVAVDEVSEPPASPSQDLDGVFADLRDEANRRFATNNPEQELAAGLAFYRAGQLDFAVPRLEAAAATPVHRFEAAATLGRIFLERGDPWRAIEWFERAAAAPAPGPAETHRLLYELGDALEGVGEVARALAICLELQAEAGNYQDVSTRVDRLLKVQARG
jgi:tetratricopeptide (TPR) repeat protein